MYDLLLAHQDALRVKDLMGYARRLGLDLERFREALRKHRYARRVLENVDSPDISGVRAYGSGQARALGAGLR
jgi:hypothetical protein